MESPTETHKAMVRELKVAEERIVQLFEGYRAAKRFLNKQFISHGNAVSKQGYASSIDPDRIRQRSIYSQAPKGWNDRSDLQHRQERWRPLVREVKSMVKQLPSQYQQELVQTRFMGWDPTPDDEDAWKALYKRWPLSFADYLSNKHEAIWILSELVPVYFPTLE